MFLNNVREHAKQLRRRYGRYASLALQGALSILVPGGQHLAEVVRIGFESLEEIDRELDPSHILLQEIAATDQTALLELLGQINNPESRRMLLQLCSLASSGTCFGVPPEESQSLIQQVVANHLAHDPTLREFQHKLCTIQLQMDVVHREVKQLYQHHNELSEVVKHLATLTLRLYEPEPYDGHYQKYPDDYAAMSLLRPRAIEALREQNSNAAIQTLQAMRTLNPHSKGATLLEVSMAANQQPLQLANVLSPLQASNGQFAAEAQTLEQAYILDTTPREPEPPVQQSPEEGIADLELSQELTSTSFEPEASSSQEQPTQLSQESETNTIETTQLETTEEAIAEEHQQQHSKEEHGSLGENNDPPLEHIDTTSLPVPDEEQPIEPRAEPETAFEEPAGKPIVSIEPGVLFPLKELFQAVQPLEPSSVTKNPSEQHVLQQAKRAEEQGAYPEALQIFQKMVQKYPESTELYHSLFSLYAKTQQFDPAWVLCDLIMMSGTITPEQNEYYEWGRLQRNARIENPISEELLLQHICHPHLHPKLMQIFALLFEHTHSSFSQALDSFGIEKDQKHIQTSPWKDWLVELSLVLRIQTPRIYKTSHVSRIQGLNSHPPAVALGASGLNNWEKERQFAELTRTLACLRPEWFWSCLFHDTFETLFTALLELYYYKFKSTTHINRVNVVKGTIAKHLDPSLHQQIGKLIEESRASIDERTPRLYTSGAVNTVNRLTLCIVGDIRQTLTTIQSQYNSSQPTSFEGQKLALLRYATSQNYTATREHLGIAVTSSHEQQQAE
ncbi:MAG: hypothetical protein EP343_28465 [Deltaproteobacteria bacterium]|nr:MAG: hypothetical protein EP343_28465 [Deltaproteobacteria bacterium]